MSNLQTILDDQFDGQLIEVLYSMDHSEDVEGIYIGEVRSDDEAHDSLPVSQRIDRLIREIGASDSSWARLFLGGIVDDPYRDPTIVFDEADRRHFELNGITAGRYITGLVYDRLPIEMSTEGDSAAKISLAIGTDYVLNLKGFGTYDTVYTYDHENADLEYDTPSDSEVTYKMTFSADLFTVKP